MRRRIPFHFVDVFAVEPLTGNPLVVVDSEHDLPVGLMRRIASEFNQSETTFVLPPSRSDADWRLRSFTRRGIEVFGTGGHNTLGAWWWLAASGWLSLLERETRFRQEIGDVVYPLSIWQRDGRMDRVVMRQQEPMFGREAADVGALAEALDLAVEDIAVAMATCQVVSTGIAHLLVPIRACNVVDRISPNAARLSSILKSVGGEGCYVFSLESRQSRVNAYARFFNPAVGISEDPATGTAAGSLAVHLVRHGLAQAGLVRIEQGAALARTSVIDTFVDGEVVSISAHCAIAGSGELSV